MNSDPSILFERPRKTLSACLSATTACRFQPILILEYASRLFDEAAAGKWTKNLRSIFIHLVAQRQDRAVLLHHEGLGALHQDAPHGAMHEKET